MCCILLYREVVTLLLLPSLARFTSWQHVKDSSTLTQLWLKIVINTDHVLNVFNYLDKFAENMIYSNIIRFDLD